MQELTLNEKVLIWINQDWANPVFDIFFEWLSMKWGFSIPLLFLIILYIGQRFGKSGWIIGCILIVTTSTSDLLGNFLKDIFQHGRPCLDFYDFIRYPDGGETRCETSTSGMPSNHAMNFFATFTVISFFFPHRHILTISITLATLVGISRIYLGEHYPSQVLVGAIFGALLGITIAVISKTALRKSLNSHDI